MRVRELEAILAALPGDMEVYVAAPRCCWVNEVDKRNAQSPGGSLSHARNPMPGSRFTDDDGVPPALVLRGDVGWWLPEPEFELRGRWPARVHDELRRV